ncbi:hypothetical protein C2E23DRAFT_572764 [Lenzites betulinus]|nr:hypothetical protein C2E23DRAFT_572764 [Lenzites betulinus]
MCMNCRSKPSALSLNLPSSPQAMADPSSTASAFVLPHFGRVYLTGIWFASMLYGLNCAVFSGSLYVLLRRKGSNWFLVGWACLLFAISTTDIIIAFFQLYRPLTNDAIFTAPGLWDLSYAITDHLEIAHSMLYSTCVFAQDLLLIWRLYMVYGKSWQIAIGPLIVECVHMACAFVATGLTARPGFSAFSTTIQHWGLASWSLDIAMNTTVTLAIAGRLWYMGRRNGANAGRFTYRGSMYTILESGGIFAGATIVCFGMDVSGSIAGVAGLWSLTQLASITPLLIIARIGLGVTIGRNWQSTAPPSTRAMSFGNSGTAIRVATDTTADNNFALSDMGSKGKMSLNFANSNHTATSC